MVPTAVATTITTSATRRLRQVALCHCGSEKYSRNHCSEKPGGGKPRNADELNAIGTTIRHGATRNVNTQPQNTARIKPTLRRRGARLKSTRAPGAACAERRRRRAE